VVEAKAHNSLDFQRYLRDPQTNWQRLGIELKISEIIEKLPAERFDEPWFLDLIEDIVSISG
jgi:hypothetical protein